MRLTPPSLFVFLISLILAAVSVASLYAHIPRIHGFVAGHRYWMMVAAYMLLFVGVAFPGA